MTRFSYMYLLLLSICFLSCEPNRFHDLLIRDVNIIDVKTGSVLTNQTVCIDKDSITAIYYNKIKLSGTQEINGKDKFLIPGLWDMHVHHNWNYTDTNPLLIANGITGVREMWGDAFTLNKLRKEISKASSQIPEIYSGSIIIDGNPPRWQGTIGVSSYDEAKIAALEQIELGFDFLKVYSGLSKEAFDAIAEIADKKAVPFSGHVPDEITIQQAALKGMSSAEHFYGVLLGSSSKQDSIINEGLMEYQTVKLLMNSFDEKAFDSLCSLMIEHQLWMCPTLVLRKGQGHKYDLENINDHRLDYLPDYLTRWWPKDTSALSSPRVKANVEAMKKEFEFILPLIGRMANKGVKFLAGSDFPNPFCLPGFSIHDEMGLMVEGGMDNLSALQTATINPAIFMKKEDKFGTVEPSKVANLVLLSKNPLDKIENTRSIENVILRGKPIGKSSITKMLNGIKRNLEKPPYSEWLEKLINQIGVDQSLDSLSTLIESKAADYRLEERDINSLGYRYLYSDRIETAIKVFKKNSELFPNSYKAYDSYAEACFVAGKYDLATESYKKVLEINPYQENARVMLDSINNLKLDVGKSN